MVSFLACVLLPLDPCPKRLMHCHSAFLWLAPCATGVVAATALRNLLQEATKVEWPLARTTCIGRLPRTKSWAFAGSLLVPFAFDTVQYFVYTDDSACPSLRGVRAGSAFNVVWGERASILCRGLCMPRERPSGLKRRRPFCSWL